MNARDDVRRLRDRQDDYDATLAAEPGVPNYGVARRVAWTIDGGSYPSVPGVFYLLEELSLTGEEVLGGDVVVTPTGNTFFAMHFGAMPPPPGSIVEAVAVPYRWVFRFDGPSEGRCRTVTPRAGTYPAYAAAYYDCELLDADDAGTGVIQSFYNIGPQVPPLGTVLTFRYSGTRWEIQYP